MTESCDYCDQGPPARRRRQAGPGPGGGQGGERSCRNLPKPLNCTNLAQNLANNEDSNNNADQASEDTGGGIGGMRSKRSPGGGGDVGGSHAAVNKLDADTNARFVKLLLSLPEDIKQNIGHNLERSWSVIENQTRLGFVYSCVYKSNDCTEAK